MTFFQSCLRLKGLCKMADMQSVLPICDSHADMILHQEGIEHISGQLFTLKEFNRVLKMNGKLILTAPNYSNLKSKLSYFLNESEMHKLLAPNLIESIWFSTDSKNDERMYFGHMYLIGMQRLKLLSTLAGFRVKKIHRTRINFTSLFLLMLFYLLIVYPSWRAYRRAIRKNPQVAYDVRKSIFHETFKLQTDPAILIDSHLFVEFEKCDELDGLTEKLSGYHKHRDADFET